MIPDHIINKAIRALITAEGRDPDDHCDEWKYAAYEDDARTILEAVAADIWDEGEYAGLDRSDDHPNPYRASETA